MQTTCPECRTTFRVSQEHLGARRGLVRCGTCSAVFNAYDTLLPELESPPEHEAPAESISTAHETDADSPVVEAMPTGNPLEEALGALELAPAEAEPTEVSDTEARLDAMNTAQDATDDATDASPVDPEAAADVQKAQFDDAKPPVRDILFEPLHSKPAKPPRTWKDGMYVGLAILLTLVLGLQAAYFLRAEIASALPFSRPALEALCQPLQCSVALPEQLTQAAIAASSLEHDPENKSRVRLTVLLANRTGQTQAWPQITLTLSDVRQAPVAQQVFRPQAYLPKDVQIDAGMAADLEREVRLDLDFGNLVASGYAVSLTYP